jgi:hypothetical protein
MNNIVYFDFKKDMKKHELDKEIVVKTNKKKQVRKPTKVKI